MAWPTVELGEIASLVKRAVTPHPGKTYRQIGVRLWGQGAYERAKLNGAETRYSHLFEVREGDIIVNKIWARNGSVSVVTSELAGCVGSPEFPTYEIELARMMPDWFRWFTRFSDLWDQCNQLSRGTSGKNRLRPEKFLNVRIPLPPLDEQRRIVARLDRVAMLIEEATKLREKVERDVAALTQSLHVVLCSDETRPLGDFVYLWEDRQAIQPDVLYPQVGIKGFAGGLFKKAAVKGSETSYRSFNRLHGGLLVVSQPKGWEGAIAICARNLAGWFVSPEYRTFRCHEGRLTSRYLDMLIRTPWFQDQLAQLTRGQGARRERLRPEMLLAMDTKMPSMDAQATALDVIDRARTIRCKRAEIEREFSELLPAMLNEVFGGEAGCSAA